jgi:hypothetical protein
MLPHRGSRFWRGGYNSQRPLSFVFFSFLGKVSKKKKSERKRKKKARFEVD